MKSIVAHLASCAEVALEGNYYRCQTLGRFDESSDSAIYPELIIDIKQNEIQMSLECTIDDKNAKKEHTVNGQIIKSVRKTELSFCMKVWTYNSADMAEATVKFILCHLIYQVANSDEVEDPCKFTRHLQNELKELLDVDINIW